jgi:hypothetical protein
MLCAGIFLVAMTPYSTAVDAPATPAATEAKPPAPPAPEVPPEGTLWRQVAGENFIRKTGLKLDVELETGVSANNTADSSASGVGGTNLPALPGDTGFMLSDLWLFIHRDMKTDILPVITPLPGPMPKKFDWGLDVEADYGRDCQPARMAGWDTHWSMNEPGASDPSYAAAHKSNFFCNPAVATKAYLPVFKGMTVQFGRWGDMLTLEIPPNPSGPNPNFFFSHSYSFLADVTQVFGWLTSVNVMRSPTHGWMAFEFGSNQGNMTLHSYAGTPFQNFEGALRWRSPHMRTWVDAQFRAGDGNIKTNAAGVPLNSTDFTNSGTFLYSPRGQMKVFNEVIINHEVGEHWALTLEGNYMKQSGDGKADTQWIFGGTGGIPVAFNFGGDHAVGIYGRAVYKFNRKFSLGVRGETLHDHNGYFLQPVNAWVTPTANPVLPFVPVTANFAHGSLNEVTFGGNYNPTKYLRIRPEFRHDWSDNPAYGLSNATVTAGTALPKKSQNTFAMDFITWF